MFSVIAYLVRRRFKEAGIRMALGAADGDVVSMHMREGCRLVLIGLPVGLVLAAITTRLMEALLFGISTLPLGSYVAAVAVLVTLSALAAFVPARGAARADPVAALRTE